VDVDHFVVVLEGALDVRVDGAEHRLEAGDGLRIPAGSTRLIRAGGSGAVTLTLGGAGGHATVGDADPVLIPWSA
jgi:quercetin dioxygenase-like cupin family protein